FPLRSPGAGPLPWEARSGRASESYRLAVAGRSVAKFFRRKTSPRVLPRSSPPAGSGPSPGSTWVRAAEQGRVTPDEGLACARGDFPSEPDCPVAAAGQARWTGAGPASL